jgi:hypothetical protein
VTVNILHYDLISEFKRQFYKDLLTQEHLQGGQVMLQKLTYPDSGTDETANFWGYVFLKGGRKYLLSSVDSDGKEIKLSECLPLLAKDLQKVAHRTDVYFLIRKPVVARFKSLQTMSFREMVNTFSSLKHSNTPHQKLMWFVTLAQMMDRCNFRVSSNAGFGKDSTIDIIGNLIGGSATVENPTLAKLEFLTHLKLLAINEVVDVSKPDWRNIQQFLLAAGAHKPEVTKHSRAMVNGVSEVLDISKFSISLMYNDIDHYIEKDTFFDDMTKDAVKDRFPALRLYGSFQEDFNQTKSLNLVKHVEEKLEDYKKLIYAYTYYKEHLLQYYHGYTLNLTFVCPPRWKTNLGRLFKVIDVYCNSQEEFNTWVNVVQQSMIDYEEMLKYPQLLADAAKTMNGKEYAEFFKGVQEQKTFIERNEFIRNKKHRQEKTNYKDRLLESVI